jgi:hypothetical protein
MEQNKEPTIEYKIQKCQDANYELIGLGIELEEMAANMEKYAWSDVLKKWQDVKKKGDALFLLDKDASR